ncbi:MAG: hypothetical protein HRT57_16210 [Crocinitomicaceae bacterium]|nr:hypothetical protein [Crocinitomicaceae bacterium]
MKNILLTSIFTGSLLMLMGCGVSGKYHTNSIRTSYAVNEAPLKLKLFGKARWTHYQITTATSYKYYEQVKYKSKNDTLYLRHRAIYGDTSILKKQFIPVYLIKGDTLESLDWDLQYVKGK